MASEMKFSLVDVSIPLSDVETQLKNQLGDKYKISYNKAGSNAIAKHLTGNETDSLLVAKNAYHRIVISFSEEEMKPGKKAIYLNEATLAGWLSFLHDNLGFIGALIIRLIYGSGDEFSNDVHGVIDKTYDIEVMTVDTSIKGAFKNLKNAFSN